MKLNPKKEAVTAGLRYLDLLIFANIFIFEIINKAYYIIYIYLFTFHKTY